MGQQDKVIAITQVVFALKPVLYKLIQFIQVDVGKKLAVQVTDWQAFVGWRVKQGLMRGDGLHQVSIPFQLMIFCAVMKYQGFRQPAGCVVLYALTQQAEQYRLVYFIKKLNTSSCRNQAGRDWLQLTCRKNFCNFLTPA